jgi:hypothetical protein
MAEAESQHTTIKYFKTNGNELRSHSEKNSENLSWWRELLGTYFVSSHVEKYLRFGSLQSD